jgi:capsular polysaccharide transport system permease protein
MTSLDVSTNSSTSLAPRSTQSRLFAWLWRHRGSLFFVGLPTLLAAIYYLLIAADLYASEARIIVRSPSHLQVSGLAGLLQGSGLSRASDDVYAVHDFILSRDAIDALQKKIDLRAIYNRPEADFLARFPRLPHQDTTEDFYRYYQSRVDISFDTTSGICSVTVKAFRPEDAKAVADALLDEAEALVNRLNQRATTNAVHDVQVEVDDLERRAAEAQQDLLAYRNRETLLDPGKTSGAIFETQSKLRGELATARTRLAELESSAPSSPQRADLAGQIAALEQQVGSQGSRLAGSDSSMAPKIREYEMLTLRQEFASKELTSALGALESARAEARRQQIYIEPVVSANLPDKALYPKRLTSILIIFVSCFLIYSIALLLLAGVNEHAQA